jgi:hypothetical protein
MKAKTSMKNITNRFETYSCGYCDLQYIMRMTEPQYYNCGVYGWNCDIYVNYGRGMAITTGYRNMRGKMIPHEIIDKYSKIAEEISKDWSKPYEETFEALEQNRENFWEEVANI